MGHPVCDCCSLVNTILVITILVNTILVNTILVNTILANKILVNTVAGHVGAPWGAGCSLLQRLLRRLMAPTPTPTLLCSALIHLCSALLILLSSATTLLVAAHVDRLPNCFLAIVHHQIMVNLLPLIPDCGRPHPHCYIGRGAPAHQVGWAT